MAFSTEMGAEVQRPIAVVIVGGLLTSTLVTLIILPLLLLPFRGGGGLESVRDTKLVVAERRRSHSPASARM